MYYIPNSNISVTRIGMELELRNRAWEDETFRRELQANPSAVLERDYPQWFPDGKVPEGVTIKIAEEDEQTVYVVLPANSHDQRDSTSLQIY